MNKWNLPSILALIERRRYVNSITTNPGATVTDIQNAEDRIGMRFPDLLKEWLLVCNGVVTTYGSVFGVPRGETLNADSTEYQTSIEYVLDLWGKTSWKAKKWIPIADDGCGSYYVLVEDPALERHSVAFIDTVGDSERLDYAVASNVYSFLAGFFQKEAHFEPPIESQQVWPFDIKWARENDPDLIKVTIAPLPWDVADEV